MKKGVSFLTGGGIFLSRCPRGVGISVLYGAALTCCIVSVNEKFLSVRGEGIYRLGAGHIGSLEFCFNSVGGGSLFSGIGESDS